MISRLSEPLLLTAYFSHCEPIRSYGLFLPHDEILISALSNVSYNGQYCFEMMAQSLPEIKPKVSFKIIVANHANIAECSSQETCIPIFHKIVKKSKNERTCQLKIVNLDSISHQNEAIISSKINEFRQKIILKHLQISEIKNSDNQADKSSYFLQSVLGFEEQMLNELSLTQKSSQLKNKLQDQLKKHNNLLIQQNIALKDQNKRLQLQKKQRQSTIRGLETQLKDQKDKTRAQIKEIQAVYKRRIDELQSQHKGKMQKAEASNKTLSDKVEKLEADLKSKDKPKVEVKEQPKSKQSPTALVNKVQIKPQQPKVPKCMGCAMCLGV